MLQRGERATAARRVAGVRVEDPAALEEDAASAVRALGPAEAVVAAPEVVVVLVGAAVAAEVLAVVPYEGLGVRLRLHAEIQPVGSK